MSTTPPPEQLVDAALHYLDQGIAVIPVWWVDENGCACPRGPACASPGKHPVEQGWQQGPFPSKADVYAWWEQYPRANLGGRTGAISGNLFVVDLDAGGREAFGPVVHANGGDWPVTRLHRTGSGIGQHFFYRAPAGVTVPNSQGRLAAHVDVRGEGGQVILPPSSSAKGPYAIEYLAPIAMAPAWLIEQVQRPVDLGMSEAPPAAPKDPAQQTAEALAYERNFLARIAERLNAKRDKRWEPGDEWDKTCMTEACHLVELSNSPWTHLTFDRAFEFYMANAPHDDRWDERMKCWRSAVERTAGKAKDGPTPQVSVMDMATEAPRASSAPVQQQAQPHEPMADAGDVHSGQVRIAFRLASAYRGRLIHVAAMGWFYYDGRRWAEDLRGYAHRAVIDVLERSLIDSITDPQLRKDVEKCESAGGVDGVLRIASRLPEFAMTAEDLDTNPALLNVANGTLDLDTMVLRPHDPADLLTKVTRASYDPTVRSQEWAEFLSQVMPDPEEQGYLQRVVGQALYGRVEEHLLPLLIGTGANGKGVFYGTVLHAVGDYGIVVAPELLLAKDRDRIPTEIMELRGARLAVASETNEGKKIDEATMKRLTGGDRITARRLYKDPVTFTPTHTLLYVTNDAPEVRGDSPSVWRRLRVVPFDVVIPEDRRDSHLPHRLEAQADAVLSWMIEGYVAYRRQGMAEPARVLAATDEYQSVSDPVRRFVAEACFISPAASANTRVLYSAWQDWAKDEEVAPMTEKAFAARLDRLGFPAGKRTKYGVPRPGIMPLTRDEDEGDSNVTQLAAWVK